MWLILFKVCQDQRIINNLMLKLSSDKDRNGAIMYKEVIRRKYVLLFSVVKVTEQIKVYISAFF